MVVFTTFPSSPAGTLFPGPVQPSDGVRAFVIMMTSELYILSLPFSSFYPKYSSQQEKSRMMKATIAVESALFFHADNHDLPWTIFHLRNMMSFSRLTILSISSGKFCEKKHIVGKVLEEVSLLLMKVLGADSLSIYFWIIGKRIFPCQTISPPYYY